MSMSNGLLIVVAILGAKDDGIVFIAEFRRNNEVKGRNLCRRW